MTIYASAHTQHRTQRHAPQASRAQQSTSPSSCPTAAPAIHDQRACTQTLAVQLATIDASAQTLQLQAYDQMMNGPANTAARAPNHTGLPDQLKAGIESLSGMRMDHVRVHYNSAQPAQLHAHAFAQGSEIHVAAGQEQHLAHEAWHVVQQAQGRVQPTMQMKAGVAVNDDQGLEHEADVMGARALAGPARDVPDTRTACYRPRAAVQQHRAVVQRLGIGERPVKDGYASLTSHASWLAKAEAYEKRLGLHAYRHPDAVGAVDAGLGKMKTVIDTHYHEAVADVDQKLELYRDVFTKNDPGSAGQIGKSVDMTTINDMLTGGNLRERMTAFYNAAYFNSPSGGTALRGFKEILTAILFQDQLDLARTLALNRVDLTEKAEFLEDSELRQSTKWLTSWTEKGYNFADDPFALGNLTMAEDFGGTVEMGMSQRERVPRPLSERDAEMRSADDYHALGIGLSPREKAYTATSLGKRATDVDYGSTKLPWLEGHTYYKMEPMPVLGKSWISDIRDSLHMPIAAGVSGTTTRMLTAYKWLNCPNPENFRLALMGWMLPAWDHSLYEIMRGSHLAGVKPAGDSDLTDVVDMYMNIAPLTQTELRTSVALNKQFPHEEVYMERTKDKTSTDADAFNSAHDDNKTAATQNYNTYGATNPDFSASHATAIYNYTSGIHSLMNAVLSNKTAIGAQIMIQAKLNDSARYACRYAWLAAHQATLSPEQLLEYNAKPVEMIDILDKGDRITQWQLLCAGYATLEQVDSLLENTVKPWISSIIEPVYEEMKVHANMTVEGLKALPPVSGMDVWRGDWTSMIGSRYEEGKEYEHDTLTSYSTVEATAKNFATSGSFSYKVLIKLRLSGKGGRDIDDFSKFSENEILMMPGSKVRITKVTWGKDSGKDIKLCEAVEV